MRGRIARAVLCAACGAVLAGAGPAAAAAPPSWLALSRAIAQPWPALQARGGHFADYVRDRAPSSRRDDYGDATLGYGLLQTGVREDDRRLVRAGLRGVTRAAKHPGSAAVAMFANLGLAGAYNLARTRLADDPLFRKVRRSWERRLRRLRILRLGAGRPVTNKSVVEAAEVLEMARTGLHSSDPHTILHDTGAAVRLAKQLVNTDLPDAAARFDRSDARAGRLALIGDFTGLPLAYHALGLGMLGRAVELLGSHASSRARALLRSVVNASWALAAPDGDVAYIGRSQAMSWTLPLTAYGAGVAAATRGAPSGRAAGWRALAAREIARLRGAYRITGDGLLITPALSKNLDRGIGALDYYVSAAGYNGLTLLALNWAIDASRSADESPGGRIGGDTPGSFVLGAGRTAFAAVRTSSAWFVVKKAQTDAPDLRYDFGLVALKVRRPDGGWRDVLPLRPRTSGGADTAGPVLRRGGATGSPSGRSLKVGGDGRVSVKGGYRRAGGGWLRDGVRFVFEPLACGVRLRIPVRAGDTYEYSAFFRHGKPKATASSLSEPGQRLSFSSPFHRALRSGYSSDMDPKLVRARLRFAPTSGGSLSIGVCDAAGG